MSVEQSGKIAAWNIMDGFDGPEALKIAEAIVAQGPDIVLLSEASKEVGGKSTEVLGLLQEAIGPVYEVAYDDKDSRSDIHSFMGIAREQYGTPETLRIGGRQGLHYQLGKLSIVGYHGIDRKYHGAREDHEVQRVIQAICVLRALPTTAAIVAGDLNAMHASDTSAQLLHKMGRLSDILPTGEPGEPQSKIARLGSLAQRLSAMASGESLQVYEDAGFVDADARHLGTKAIMGGFLSTQLDHILTRGVAMTDFAVIPARGLTDHDMVTARFAL